MPYSIGWPDAQTQTTIQVAGYGWRQIYNTATGVTLTNGYVNTWISGELLANWPRTTGTTATYTTFTTNLNQAITTVNQAREHQEVLWQQITAWGAANNFVFDGTARPAVRKESAEELRLKRLAERKSRALLREILGDRRYRLFRKSGAVFVASRKHSDMAYEIAPGRMIQLHKRVNGEWRMTRGRLCIHPAEQMPVGDEVASLVLMARFDEDDLWKTANLHGDPTSIIPLPDPAVTRALERIAA